MVRPEVSLETFSGVTGFEPVRLVHVDLTHCLTLRNAINRIAAALNAPEYFGQNLDALIDIVSDRPKGEDIVVISGWTSLPRTQQKKLESALAVRPELSDQIGEGYARFVILEEGHLPEESKPPSKKSREVNRRE